MKINHHNIKILGITQNLPSTSSVFKSFSIAPRLYLPSESPDIKHLVSILVKPFITSSKAIQIPCMDSIENQVLTGWVLQVQGHVEEKIEYAEDSSLEKVFGAEFKIPFSTYIALPKDYVPNSIKVIPYIENIYPEVEDERSIFESIFLFLDACSSY